MSNIEKQKSMAQFLKTPNTSLFLENELKDKKSQFVSNLITLTDSDKYLAECDPAKLMKVAMNATALNLPLNKNLGYAYVIAYKGNPSFQIGYKGFIQLALRTGAYKHINACTVNKGELVRNKFTGEIISTEEKPDAGREGFLAYIKMHSGFEQSLYMTDQQMLAHAKKYSQSMKFKKDNSLWTTDYETMGLKTVLKLLLSKYGLLSTEMEKAFEADSNSFDTQESRGSIQDAVVVQQDIEPIATTTTGQNPFGDV